MFWERFWPAVQIPLIVVCLYVAVSFLGAWQLLGFYGSAFVSIVFLAVLAWSSYPLLRLKLPNEVEGLRKVELASGLPHRPLLSYRDEQATGMDDDEALALWAAHQKALRTRLKNLRVGGVNPRGFTKDPYALRVFAVMLLVVGYSVSDANRWSSLLIPFRAEGVGSVVPARIDAWVTPPAYTGEAPVFLSGDANQLRDERNALSIASGSTVLVRAQGTGEFSVVYFSRQGQEFLEPERVQTGAGETSEAMTTTEWRFPLNSSGRLQILQNDSPKYSWKIAIRPDLPPRIRLFDDPEEQLSGSLKLTYLVQDDYRVVSAEAIMDKVQRDDEKTSGRSLVEAPRFNLSLPPKDAKMAVGQTYQDLTAHPWAGSEVSLVLVARDEAEQEGRSQPVYIKLPERRFNKPLARAVVEQRRNLAMNVESYSQVVDVLDVLMIAPERFIDDAGSYLPLRFAYSELVAAETDDDLRAMLDVLWNVALTIEDGGLSAAERALREAQEALRRALEQGASEQEIAELMDDLRKALDDYLKSMAQQMRDNPQQLGQMPMDENGQQITPRDLDDMLRRMEELAKTGSLEAARELLAQMQQMLENMQNAQQRQQTPNEQQRQMLQALENLGDMIQKQRKLMDETHKFDPDSQQRRPHQRSDQQDKRGQNGQMSDEEAQEAFRQLQKQQRNLSDELQKLLDGMANNGTKPNKDLDSAGNSMEEAGDALGAQEADEAVSEQSQALESLRKGAQALAEQLAGQSGGRGQATTSPLNEDPLGRMRRVEGPEFGSQVKVPDEIEVQRARRILEELRRRLSDPDRPQLELEYLERLMKRY
ncbi:TIGR02302 family protein [Pseudovibrio japonicus]|uniref:TIGR02302 family protein n=1 Tax=Pseudovibrio japonicus TaxID=366534 RepID=A0ABQ3E5W3_9HYPH|nr:TIGR02302 family protein [Pseudovibrio japonicus]